MPRVAEVVVSTTLEVIECDHDGCGVVFGLTQDFIKHRRRDHRMWYCPNGHSGWYPRENEQEKLQRELAGVKGDLKWYRERLKREEEANLDLANSNRALKGAKTRILNRVKAGVCPFCRRNFENLARHMDSKHKHTPEPQP